MLLFLHIDFYIALSSWIADNNNIKQTDERGENTTICDVVKNTETYFVFEIVVGQYHFQWDVWRKKKCSSENFATKKI